MDMYHSVQSFSLSWYFIHILQIDKYLYAFYHVLIILSCFFKKEIMITDQHGNQIQNLSPSCLNSLGVSGNGLDKSDLTTVWQVLPTIPCTMKYYLKQHSSLVAGGQSCAPISEASS